MLIGISGPSCSGKSTLARIIAEMLDAPVLHLDRYFIEDAPRPIVNGHPSFERPEQYDGAALFKDAMHAFGDSPLVVVEGFLLFAYPRFELACGQMIHLDVPHHVLAERRLARAGAAASDVKGGRIKAADDGWQAHGEEEWRRYGAFQADIAGIRTIRPAEFGGSDPSSPEDIANDILDGWSTTRLAA